MVAITYFNVFKSKSYIHISMGQQLVKTKMALSLKEKGRCKKGLEERKLKEGIINLKEKKYFFKSKSERKLCPFYRILISRYFSIMRNCMAYYYPAPSH